MIGSKRKYLSEFAVNIYSARWLMISASQLRSGGDMDAQHEEISKECHIYLICKTPILSLKKDSFAYDNETISGHLTYSVNGEKRDIAFQQPFPLLDGATKLELSDYPHREIITVNDNNEEIRYLPASAISMTQGFHLNNPELSNLEVLYIGQAYGDGNRSAFDRLQNHSTLQKILAEEQYSSPDSEISILTFEYLQYRIINQIDGRSGAEIQGQEDSKRFYSILENPLTEHQQVCLIEAALIRYFQPKYNEIYKESFPSQTHKILEECYNLDISGLIVEINTDELRFSLFSDVAPPKMHHISKVDLISHEDRWGFFHFMSKDGEIDRMPDVITGS